MIVMTLAALASLSQGPDFNWSGPVPAGKGLTVRNVVGDIRIEPAAGATAAVTAVKRAGQHGDPKDVQIRQVSNGDGVLICVVYPGSRGGDCGDADGQRDLENDTRVDITVRLPAGAVFSALTVSGDVIGQGLRGATAVRSVSGDVTLTDVIGAVVEGHSVSGDVRLERIGADEVIAESVSGDLVFSGEVRRVGSYDFKTVSGDVTLEIPGGAGATVTGSTLSGDLRSSFSLTTTEKSGYTGQQKISGTIGDGSARIRVESLSGDVTLRKQGGR